MGKELAAIIKRRLASLCRTLRRSDRRPSAGWRGSEKSSTICASCRRKSIGWNAAFGDDCFDALAARVNAFAFPRKPTIRNAPAGKASADAAVESVRTQMGKMVRFIP